MTLIKKSIFRQENTFTQFSKVVRSTFLHLPFLWWPLGLKSGVGTLKMMKSSIMKRRREFDNKTISNDPDQKNNFPTRKHFHTILQSGAKHFPPSSLSLVAPWAQIRSLHPENDEKQHYETTAGI